MTGWASMARELQCNFSSAVMNDKTVRLDLGKPSGFRDLVGYRTTEWREGFAVFEVDIGAQHHNSSGFLHGGVYVTILDAAMGHASTWCSIGTAMSAAASR